MIVRISRQVFRIWCETMTHRVTWLLIRPLLRHARQENRLPKCYRWKTVVWETPPGVIRRLSFDSPRPPSTNSQKMPFLRIYLLAGSARLVSAGAMADFY